MRNSGQPEILTERLKLDPLTAADAPAMFAYRSDPEVCRYQTFEPGSRADVEAFIASLQADTFDKAGTWFQFAIRRRDTGRLIGDFGTHFLADDPRQVEIGFTVSPDHQGQGFGTEAVRGVLDLLFGSLRKHRVIATADPRNVASIALLKRVGLRQEAHFRQCRRLKGAWVDDVVFGILAEEWKERRPS